MTVVFLILAFGPIGAGDALPIEFTSSFPPALTGMAIVIASGVVIGALCALTARAVVTLNRSALILARILLWAANLAVIASGAAVEALDVELPLYWLMGPSTLLAVGMWAAPAIGLVRLRVSRGEFRSTRYERLLTARDEDAEIDYSSWLHRVRTAVREGKLDLRQFRGADAKLARSLGLYQLLPKRNPGPRRSAQDRLGTAPPKGHDRYGR